MSSSLICPQRVPPNTETQSCLNMVANNYQTQIARLKQDSLRCPVSFFFASIPLTTYTLQSE